MNMSMTMYKVHMDKAKGGQDQGGRWGGWGGGKMESTVLEQQRNMKK